MIFNSLEFFIFLPIVLLLYHSLQHKQQNLMLLGASYLFYGWWDPRFLFLIALSTSIDYVCGKLIANPKLDLIDVQKSVSFLTVTALAFLGFFNLSSPDLVPMLSLGLGVVCVFFVLLLNRNKLAKLSEDHRRKLALTISMCANLGILAIFKYFNFFVYSAELALVCLLYTSDAADD